MQKFEGLILLWLALSIGQLGAQNWPFGNLSFSGLAGINKPSSDEPLWQTKARLPERENQFPLLPISLVGILFIAGLFARQKHRKRNLNQGEVQGPIIYGRSTSNPSAINTYACKSILRPIMGGLKMGMADTVAKPLESGKRGTDLTRVKPPLQTGGTPHAMQERSLDQKFLDAVFAVIEDRHTDHLFSVEELSQAIALSRSQLHRKLKSLMGQGPNELIRKHRLEAAHKQLVNRTGTVSEIAYDVGFNSPAYFSKCFRDHYGYSPSQLCHSPHFL